MDFSFPVGLHPNIATFFALILTISSERHFDIVVGSEILFSSITLNVLLFLVRERYSDGVNIHRNSPAFTAQFEQFVTNLKTVSLTQKFHRTLLAIAQPLRVVFYFQLKYFQKIAVVLLYA